MTGLRRAIYNPGMLQREELIASFTARTTELQLLVKDLQQGGKQHHLIIGQRGAGKTTMLLRLACAIEEDAQLQGSAVALRFPEEQYNIARLSDFWLNCVDSLTDALEQRGEARQAAQLDAQVAALDALEEPERASGALQLLVAWAAQHQRLLVLLVDNIDLVFTRLAGSQWALREALSLDNRLVVIGACSSYPEELIQYKSAFYEFFHLQELGPLPEEEARAMLLHLAQITGCPRVAEVLEHEPGRFKALLVLSGGMPRTLALLHGILAQDSARRAEDDLELLLDQVTPYYKARFEELPPQSQLVFDAVALAWHPVTAAECAAKAHLELNPASAQLNRLVNHGVLEKGQAQDRSRLTFQVRERFFNLWYLMRASRRLRRKLLWLTGFLQTFYGQAEVERRARELLQTEAGKAAATEPARLLAFASAVEEPALRRALEFHAIEQLVSRPRDWGAPRELLELDGEDQHLEPVVTRVSAVYDVQQKLRQAEAMSASKVADGGVKWIAGTPWVSMADKQAMASMLAQHGVGKAPASTSLIEQMLDAFGPAIVNATGRGQVPSLPDLKTLEELRDLLALCGTDQHRFAVAAGAAEFGALDFLALLHELNGDELATTGALSGMIRRYAMNSRQWPVLRELLRHALMTPSASPTLLQPWIWGLIVAAGWASEAAALLEETGQHEHALPLYEALLAAGKGLRGPLPYLAPEVRGAAEQILSVLWQGLEATAAPAAAQEAPPKVQWNLKAEAGTLNPPVRPGRDEAQEPVKHGSSKRAPRTSGKGPRQRR